MAELEKKLKTLEVSGLWSLQGLSDSTVHCASLGAGFALGRNSIPK